jgi:hypothetical protein
MHTTLTYHSHLTHIDDLRREAAQQRLLQRSTRSGRRGGRGRYRRALNSLRVSIIPVAKPAPRS